MPTYEYTCRNCGHTIEVFQKFTDKPLKTHLDCGGELMKVFHARGVVFKGGGFYATDSRPKPTSDKPATSNGSESTKTETKPKPEKKAKTETAASPD